MELRTHRDVALSISGLSKCYQIARLNDKEGPAPRGFLDRLGFGANRHRTTREPFWALRDVSLEIPWGEVVGVVGRNGAGKSTLLKILSRITEPTAGRVDVYGRIGSLLEVGTGFHPELTGRENIYLNGQILGMRRREIDHAFDAIVDFSEIEGFLDTPVKRYSSGMYVRLAFAVATHLQPEILIIDEVLAVGDAAFQRKCVARMVDVARSGRSVLFVSHNMAVVKELCRSAVLLDHGRVVRQGSLDEALAAYLGSSTDDRREFPPGTPVRSAYARQEDDVVRLYVEVDAGRPLATPNLGFVISDHLGSPVCGTNPVVNRSAFPVRPVGRGTITATLTSPRLLDGTYQVSLWLDDGSEMLFHEKHCVRFDVRGMARPLQLDPKDVGWIEPECRFDFAGAN